MSVHRLAGVSNRRVLLVAAAAAIAAAAALYLYSIPIHPLKEPVVRPQPALARTNPGSTGTDSIPAPRTPTDLANGDRRKPALPSIDAADPGAYPGESANHGARNLWGIVSDDGKTFQTRRASQALTGTDSYHELMDELTRAPDAQKQQRITETITNELAAIATNASIYEMACGSRMCIGTLVLPSDDVARQLAPRLSDSREESGIQGVMIELESSAPGLNRLLLVTDPAVKGTLLAVGPDFKPPAPPTPQEIEALVKAMTQAHPPKQ